MAAGNIIVKNFVFLALCISSSVGFLCYSCSYSIWNNDGNTDCIYHPEMLSTAQQNLKCGNYCVYSENYDKGKQVIESFFRSCATETWGNDCYGGQSFIQCKGMCKGDHCNRNNVGQSYKSWLKRHSNTQGGYNGEGWNDGTVNRINISLFCKSLLLCFILSSWCLR